MGRLGVSVDGLFRFKQSNLFSKGWRGCSTSQANRSSSHHNEVVHLIILWFTEPNSSPCESVGWKIGHCSSLCGTLFLLLLYFWQQWGKKTKKVDLPRAVSTPRRLKDRPITLLLQPTLLYLVLICLAYWHLTWSGLLSFCFLRTEWIRQIGCRVFVCLSVWVPYMRVLCWVGLCGWGRIYICVCLYKNRSNWVRTNGYLEHVQVLISKDRKGVEKEREPGVGLDSWIASTSLCLPLNSSGLYNHRKELVSKSDKSTKSKDSGGNRRWDQLETRTKVWPWGVVYVWHVEPRNVWRLLKKEGSFVSMARAGFLSSFY